MRNTKTILKMWDSPDMQKLKKLFPDPSVKDVDLMQTESGEKQIRLVIGDHFPEVVFSKEQLEAMLAEVI